MEKFRKLLTNTGYVKRKDLQNEVEVWHIHKNAHHYIYIKPWKKNKVAYISHTNGIDDIDWSLIWMEDDIKNIDKKSMKDDIIDFEYMLNFLN